MKECEEWHPTLLVIIGLLVGFVVYLMHNNAVCVDIIRDRDKTIKAQEAVMVEMTGDLIRTSNELEYAEGWKAELKQKYPGAKL